jgi:hypothetical protein
MDEVAEGIIIDEPTKGEYWEETDGK